MSKSKIGKTAIACAFVAFICIVTAFITPNWLETDANSDKSKFVQIGLWQVCFHGFKNPQHLHDTKFYGCWWVFEEEYYGLHNVLLPHFFIVTQFFFTLCITLLMIGGLSTLMYICCSQHHNKYLVLLWTTGSNLTLGGICGCIAVIIFGSQREDAWMPNWKFNIFGWSYAVAIIGSATLVAAGILFLIEGKKHKTKLRTMQ